ncbi:hypothetical protein G6F46_015727 [Rhizopus delemar]|nr:hypothetical protein G6F46_015727 [Rhizopus delemar]
MTGAGVRAGAASAYQPTKDTWAMPASVKVGTSGSCGTRCSPVTASARTLPARTCGAADDTVSTPNATSPPIMAVINCALPL